MIEDIIQHAKNEKPAPFSDEVKKQLYVKAGEVLQDIKQDLKQDHFDFGDINPDENPEV